MYLSQGLDVGLIEWTKRLAQGSKAPPFSAKTCPSQQSTSLEDHKRPLATSVQQMAERSQREAGRPPLGRPAWTCLLSGNASYTNSKKQFGTSTQRRWPDGHTPRPAGLREAGRPHLAATQANHNCHNHLQPTPRASPAQNRPWKAINRSLISHL